MTVTLLIDIYSSIRAQDHVHIDDNESFLDACRKIDKALSNGTHLNVVLHNPAQIRWFDFYRDRIRITKYNPSSELADTLCINESLLPLEVVQDPKFIITAGLHEKAKLFPLNSSVKVESWILEHTLDPVWAYEQIDAYDQLASVLLYLIKRQHLKIHPTLQALRNKRIANWKAASGLKKVITWLFTEDPIQRAESILFARLIWNYPHETKLKALQFGNRWSDLSLLEDYHLVISQLPLNDYRELSLPPEIRIVIDDYLNQTLNSKSLDSVIGMLSGINEEEISIKRYLESCFDIIDESWNDTLLELNRIFLNNRKSKSFISYLQKLVPIRKPSLILKTMSWDQVSEWLENEYFPYYRWCSALGKISCTEPSISDFENWLNDNYYNLTRTKAYSPCAGQSLIASKISYSSVMYVIIDCLPWIYAQYIQERLIEKGIKSFDTTMHVTTLPTITRVAKQCLLRGQLPGQLPAMIDQSAKTYSELFAQSLNVSVEDILYSNSNESDIASMVTNRKRAYLYLDNDIDEMIHKPIHPELRRTRIESHLNEIVDGLITAKEDHRLLYGKELSIVISSDHGFTELPEQNNILTVNENSWHIDHGRLLIGSNEENPSPSDYIHISREMLGGGSCSYYVARGFRTIETRPRGAAHGGMTPQEVIVPMILIDSSVDMTFRSLRVAITGEIRRGRAKNNITVEIFNSNIFPVSIKGLDLRLITVTDPSNRRIMPGESIKISATMDGARIREQCVIITCGVLLSYRGRDITDNLEYQVATVGAATSDQAFEDEFET